MSNENNNDPKTPAYKASLVKEVTIRQGNTETKKDKFYPFGDAWNRKNGRIALDSPMGTILLTPPKELERLRNEKKENSEEQEHEVEP
ncbi:hypothetical protein P886_4182 [Alteromonadaceae bacterium 2753L.S.0a.02]|nr:hypothetical protein P886_4182 [Alteromonadaceae bacterium 2753L.S.0a.02]